MFRHFLLLSSVILVTNFCAAVEQPVVSGASEVTATISPTSTSAPTFTAVPTRTLSPSALPPPSPTSTPTATIELPDTVTPTPQDITSLTTEFKDLVVTVSYPNQAPSIADLRLVIARQNQIIYDDKVSPGLQAGDENNFDLLDIKSPEFHNLDQDAEMEIILHFLTNGSYCCAYTAIFDYDSTHDLYVKSSQKSWGPFRNLPRLVDVDEDGDTEFISHNEDFSSTFGPYAISGAAPIQVWQYTPDGLRIVTKEFPELVRQDADQWWQAYTDEASDWYGLPVSLAAHIADQCILGETIDWAQAATTYENGVSNEPWDAYLQQLQKTLKDYGYACLLDFLDPTPTATPTSETGWTTITDLRFVKDMAFDKDGLLWLATSEGAVKWDPTSQTSTKYTVDDGLAGDNVKSIAVAPDGVVWFGTLNGVSRFDGQSWTSYTEADGLGHNDIEAIAVASDGTVWAGSGDPRSLSVGGVSRFDGQSWTDDNIRDDFLYNSVVTVAPAPDGTLWVGIGGGGGIAHFNGESWTHFNYTNGFNNTIEPGNLSPDWVNSMAMAPDGTLWVGTYIFRNSAGYGVFSYDGERWTNYTSNDGLTGNIIPAIAIEPEGGVWVGAYSYFGADGGPPPPGGASYFDGQTWTAYTPTDGLVGDKVSTIAIAPDGAVWFATDDGISRFMPPE